VSAPDVERQIEVFRALAEHLVSEEELAERLGRGRPLRVKLGCDPSAPDLHLGHSIVLDKLRALADLGHTIIFLVGDFTAMIGDPSGRSKTRPALSREEVLRNAETYRDQVSLVLDVESTELRFNSEWMDAMTPADLIRLASHQPVARMLERDDFKTRFRGGETIAIHEFLYPLVQAYDSVALEADVEIGGTDQLFNLLLGREIQRAYGHDPQIVLTTPLLEGTDGVEKMSKSLGNAIGFRDPPEEICGRVMSIPDTLLPRWIRLLPWTDLPIPDAEPAAPPDGATHPRDLKAGLARAIVHRFHGAEAVRGAEAHFDRLFRQKEAPDDVPEVPVTCSDPAGIPAGELLRSVGFAASASEAKRLVAQGGVRVDRERLGDPGAMVPCGEHLLQVGKRRFARVRIATRDS
jgi:tyrosyl-tRNA synthetase